MQRKKKSVAVNFIYNMIYQISLVILPLITSPYLSRTIGSEGLGSYSFSYSVAYCFYLFGMLGINNYGNRSIAAVRDDRQKLDFTFSKIYYFQLLISSVATICYIGYCVLICKTNTSLALAQIFFVLSAVISVDWFFFGIEEFRVTVIRKTVIKIVTSISVFIFIKSMQQLFLYTFIIAFAEFVGEIYLWYYIPRFVRFKKVPVKDIFQDSKSIVVLFVPIIATSIYRYMDKIMIGTLSTMRNVGQYDYAEKIIMICLGCMTALGTVMLPKMANLIANNKKNEMKKYLHNSMQFAMFMACGISFGLAAVAKRFSVVYFGSDYTECGLAMMYLSVTVLPIAWANVVRTQYLIPSAKDKEYVISVIIGAILNFSLNFMLIPKFGIKGAIIGTITAEFSVALLQTILVRKDIDVIVYIKNTIPFFICGLFMCFLTIFIGKITENNAGGLLLQVIIGGISYISLTIIYCYFKKNNIYYLIKSSIQKTC